MSTLCHGENQPKLSSRCSPARAASLLLDQPPRTHRALPVQPPGPRFPQANYHGHWDQKLGSHSLSKAAGRSSRRGPKNRSLDSASRKTLLTSLLEQSEWSKWDGSQMAVGCEVNGRWWSWGSKGKDSFFTHFSFFCHKGGWWKSSLNPPSYPYSSLFLLPTHSL